ncbi:hypothetical protein HAX54_025982 [Datura stramonium]|uniref:Uncharacterized protein n=1 Tax=Datura stramonium TaxID=4076 RepID=A0ABS8V0E2_DATST|nr:hypothetical protein [Datura stramonium]
MAKKLFISKWKPSKGPPKIGCAIILISTTPASFNARRGPQDDSLRKMFLWSFTRNFSLLFVKPSRGASFGASTSSPLALLSEAVTPVFILGRNFSLSPLRLSSEL